MDGTITFSDGAIYWTTDRTDSDDFLSFSLEQHFGKAFPAVRVVRNNGEKPFFSPRVAEFSLTHTKGFLAVALSARPVGLDVENVGRFKNRVALKDRTASEKSTIQSPNNNQSEFCSDAGENPAADRKIYNADCETFYAARGGVDSFPQIAAGDQQKRIAQRFFGAEIETSIQFFKLWTAAEAVGKRDETFFLKKSAGNSGTVEFFTVGDFLLALAY